jgi:C-terminal processing protease CtpA/Prc
MKSILKYTICAGVMLSYSNATIAQEISNEEKLQTTIKVPQLIGNLELMYVEAVDKKQLESDLIKGLHNGLSPYSVYQDAKTVSAIYPTHTDQYQSLGVTFKFSGDSIEIMKLIPGGGAEKAGLLAGDKIYELDGKPFEDEYYYCEIANKLIGEAGSKVEVSYGRNGELKKTTVTRSKVADQSVVILGDDKRKGAINEYTKALPYFDAMYPDSVSNGIITEYGIRYMLDQLDPLSS